MTSGHLFGRGGVMHGREKKREREVEEEIREKESSKNTGINEVGRGKESNNEAGEKTRNSEVSNT